MTAPDTGPSNSLERALKILDMNGHSPSGLTNKEISQLLQIATSSASYILQRLEREGYVRRQPNGRYEIGMLVLSLASGVLRVLGFHHSAAPVQHRRRRVMKAKHAQHPGGQRKHAHTDLVSAVWLPPDVSLALQPLENVGRAAGGDLKKLADFLIGQTTGRMADHVQNFQCPLQGVAGTGIRCGHREPVGGDSSRYGFSHVRLETVSRE